MPLNASNRLNLDPPTGRTVVQMTVRPSSRAVAEGWNTQVQRAKSTSPSTDAITEVATVPASRRVVYDRGVPSTTGGHNWRARHVKEGSTEGDWTDWRGGGPRTGPGEPIPPDFPSIHDEDDWTRLRQEQTLTKGKLANSTGKRFMDLESTGTNDFIHAEDGSGKVTVSIQADGDADFSGTVSSSQFTASVITQGETTAEAVQLRTDDNFGISGTTKVPSIGFYNDGTLEERIWASSSGFHIGMNPSVVDAGIRVKSTEVLLEGGDGDIIVSAPIKTRGGNLTLDPSGRVSFEGDNLSTSAGSAQEFLTVSTTAGARKIQLHQI